MRKAVGAIFGAALVAVTMTACNEDPLSEDRDKAVFFQLNPSVVVVNAGSTARVAAVIVNKYGGSTLSAVTAEPCDSKITAVKDTARTEYQPPERFVITAANALGSSCLIVKSEGVTDTITVRVVPASIALVADTAVGSGADMSVTVRFLTATGATATGMSVSDVTLSVTPSTAGVIDATGKFTGQAPGTATVTGVLKASLGATRSATATVKIKEGPFTGTVAQSAGRGGQILTFTAGAVKFDADTKLVITGTVDSVTFLEKDSAKIIAAVPFGKAAGTALKYTISNLGPNQLGVGGTFTTTTANLDDTWGNNTDPFTAPVVPVGVPFVGTLGDTGSEEYFTVNVTTAGTYRLQVDWSNGSDIDVYLTNAAYTSNLIARETSANPEVGTANLSPGTYIIDLYQYEAAAATQTYRVRFTKQ
ncbi:MAG: hypothetical protein FIB01_09105 [Gemmatimonadetes bacterium]|nr:hypothetical protein [Gemmatimonadota bacterium]